MVQTVRMAALFEEDVPNELMYPECDCGSSPTMDDWCKNPLDKESFIPGYLEKQVLQLTSQTLLTTYFGLTADIQLNNVDEQVQCKFTKNKRLIENGSMDWRSASRENYNDFCKRHPSITLTFDQWRNIIYDFNESFKEYILETGDKVKFPFGFGEFSINKKKSKKYKSLRKRWDNSRKNCSSY